jgi:hypothetical protein
MSQRDAPAPVAALLALIVSACASGPPFVDTMQPKAVSMAESQAKFALNCPQATGSVLNSQELQPLVFGGPVRAEYSIGVAGCDKRTVVKVLCSENNNQCVAGR